MGTALQTTPPGELIPSQGWTGTTPGKIATVVRLARGIVTDDKSDMGKRGVVEL